MARNTTTRDVGLAIRDFIEDMAFSHVDEEGGESPNSDAFAYVDCSDANNLEILTEQGQRFRVSVVAI